MLTSSTIGTAPTSCAGLTISGGSVVNLNAPTTGATQGFAFMSAHACAVGKVATLTGGSTQNITGTIYLPTYSVSYSGGATTSGTTTCVQLIADTVSFTGGSGLGNNCGTHAASTRRSATPRSSPNERGPLHFVLTPSRTCTTASASAWKRCHPAIRSSSTTAGKSLAKIVQVMW